MSRRVFSRCFAALALVLASLPANSPGADDAPTASAAPAENALDGYDRVEVAPTKTSIYVGTVAMTMPEFTRRNGAFHSSYVAKVFPYFFYNEHGTLSITFSTAMLQQLARGEAVDFTGRAVRADGAPRDITGRASPVDARSGKIKVRVRYSKRVELIFNTTYRFPDLAKAP